MTGFGSVWYTLGLQAGARMAVFGAGAVGMSALIAAKLREPELLVAADVVPDRLQLALELGATHAINGRSENVVERIREITKGAELTAAHDMRSGVTVKPVIVHRTQRCPSRLIAIGTPVCRPPPPGPRVASSQDRP